MLAASCTARDQLLQVPRLNVRAPLRLLARTCGRHRKEPDHACERGLAERERDHVEVVHGVEDRALRQDTAPP